MTITSTPTPLHAPQPGEWIDDLVRAHRDLLLRIAAARVGPDLAADVVSESFVIAWDRRADFDPTLGDERAWLVGIVCNRCDRHARAERRWMRRQQRLGARYSAPLQDVTEDSDGRLDAVAMSGRLWAALAKLKRDERTALLLVAHAGMTPKEVAEALGIPSATVRSHLLRARRQMAAELSIDLGKDLT